MDPNFGHALRWRGLAHLELRQCEAARRDLRDAVKLDANPIVRGEQILVLGRCGDADNAKRLSEQLELEARAGYVSPIALMLARLGLGDTPGALQALEAVEQSGNMVLGIATAPSLDPLRAEPAFQRILGAPRRPATR